MTTKNRAVTGAVWTIQGLLALLFLFAGGMKLVMSAEMMKGPIALPIEFLRFIGAAELLGAVGLILPGLLGIRRQLTPIAAGGLLVIMLGATAISGATMGVGSALVPFVTGVLCVVVIRARRSWLARPEASLC